MTEAKEECTTQFQKALEAFSKAPPPADDLIFTVVFDERRTPAAMQEDEYWQDRGFEGIDHYLDGLERQLGRVGALPREGETVSDIKGEVYTVAKVEHLAEPDDPTSQYQASVHLAPRSEATGASPVRIEIEPYEPYIEPHCRGDDYFESSEEWNSWREYADDLAKQMRGWPHLPRPGDLIADPVDAVYCVDVMHKPFDGEIVLFIGTRTERVDEAPSTKSKEAPAPVSTKAPDEASPEPAEDEEFAIRQYVRNLAGPAGSTPYTGNAYTYRNPRVTLVWDDWYANRSRDGQGRIVYQCGLTEKEFAFAPGVPVPRLVFEYYSQDGEQIDPDEPHYTIIHPDLVSRGEGAIKQAILEKVERDAYLASDRLLLAAEYETLLDQDFSVDWPSYGASDE